MKAKHDPFISASDYYELFGEDKRDFMISKQDDVFICDGCGMGFPADEKFKYDGMEYCKYCAEDAGFVKCLFCGDDS